MDVIHHPKTRNKDDDYISIDSQRQETANPFTEVQILEGHKDITRRLLKLDGNRFLSTGDDGHVIIWDPQTGRRLRTFDAHRRPVTALLLVPPRFGEGPAPLLTASADREMRLRNDDGTTRKLLEHRVAVKCLLACDDGFYSGGESLCAWNREGELVDKLPRAAENSDIVALVGAKNDRLIAATSNNPHLDVYQVEKSPTTRLRAVSTKKLYAHREAVRCLVAVNEKLFASGSLDGSIHLWSSHTLSHVRCLNFEETYSTETWKMLLFEVSQLLVIGDEHLFAAVGKGFQVHNVNRAQGESLLAQRRNAHLATVHGIAYLQSRHLLVTCSEDATIRLWNVALDDLQSRGKIRVRRASFSASVKTPSLVGELVGHSGSVLSVVDLSPIGFASCGTDSLVLLWKEGNKEEKKRFDEFRVARTETQCRGLKTNDDAVFHIQND
ncbi:WD repeat-containing protein 41-like [Oscarella lobularis]|uniref:WD repeat-containing protein 41-like n=1 Tax=Oscarella lobularis TaxID=121494 RepID=UPI003313CCA2